MTGQELRERRAALGLTQEALARRIGVALNTIQRWELGTRRIAHPELLDAALQLAERERAAAN